MKIDNFVRIIDGKLCTLPPIDAFASIAFEISRVSHGDLFVDMNASKDAIHQALQKGAYAVLTTLPYGNEDDESAWIEVNHLEKALIKLLRYTITQKLLHVIRLSPVQAAFLEQILPPKSAKRLKNDLISIANLILGAKDEELFYTSDALLCSQIAPAATLVEQNVHVSVKMSAKGLFLSSFEHKGRYWSDQKIPEPFVEAFLSLLHFCDDYDLAYHLEHLSFIEHFYPQFISASMAKKEFGSSDRALIFEPDATFLEEHLRYLSRRLEASTYLLCLPESFPEEIRPLCPSIRFKSFDKLAEILSAKRFSYALILGDKEAFEPFYATPLCTQQSLF
jgi:ferrochelatase